MGWCNNFTAYITQSTTDMLDHVAITPPFLQHNLILNLQVCCTPVAFQHSYTTWAQYEKLLLSSLGNGKNKIFVFLLFSLKQAALKQQTQP